MAKVKEVHVNIGMSIDVKGVWVKVGCGSVITVDEDTNAEDRQAFFEQAFEEAEEAVNKELKRLEVGGE
jgi:hypothetical protein